MITYQHLDRIERLLNRVRYRSGYAFYVIRTDDLIIIRLVHGSYRSEFKLTDILIDAWTDREIVELGIVDAIEEMERLIMQNALTLDGEFILNR